ncbi:MAG: hypothetical protein PHV56_06515 [Clostridia bacterium]|nr:hypothetical protein [Clostridia bacterium]
MKRILKRFAGFMAITLCCAMLVPFVVMADQLPVLSDYNNLPEGCLVMGMEDVDRSVKGSNSYLLVINERVRQSTSEYTRNIFYDFSNLPDNTSNYSSKRQDFEGRNGRIVQSPGVVMTFQYTDRVTGPEEFLKQYTAITDEEYRNKSRENTPDSIKIETIGKYKAVHCTIIDEQAEGYFQNEHWYIPLSTSIPHYGTVYLKLIISNDVRIYGDLKIDEMTTIYEQWLEECLVTTENWVNELMKVTYNVRTENFVEGPVSGDWPQPGDDPTLVGKTQPEDDPVLTEEPQSGGDTAPVQEPESSKDPVLPDNKNSANEERGAGSNSDDYVDPAEAAMLSILAILLAILFGNAGGFVPPVPVGAGVPSGGGPVSTGDLSRWIKPDDDGDLIATDPVSGQQRSFVNNGDGTFTDPVTGVTYTPQELNDQLERRAENADTIWQDETQFERNVAEDSKRNEERTSFSLDTERELQDKRAADERELRQQRMAEKLGIKSDASREHIQSAYEHERDSALADSEYEAEVAKEYDESIETLEKYEDGADYLMSAGEALGGTPGKVVSATYKGVKNIGSTMAEKGVNTGAFVEGAIKGGTEAATTLMDAGVGKAGVTIGGTIAGEIAEAVNDNEDIGDAIKEGLVKGAGNASIGAVGDAIGGAVEGEGLLNKAAEATEKLAETAYGKEIVDPNLKKV